MLPTDIIFIIVRYVYLSDLSTWQRVCWGWKSISDGEIKRRATIALLSYKIRLALQIRTARGNARTAEFVQVLDSVPYFEWQKGNVVVKAVADVDMVSLTVPDLSGDDLSDESFYFIYGVDPGAQNRGELTSDLNWDLNHIKLHGVYAIPSDPEHHLILDPARIQFRPLPRFEEFAFRIYIAGCVWSCHYRDRLPWQILQIMLLQPNGPWPPHIKQIHGEKMERLAEKMERLHTDFGPRTSPSDLETCHNGSIENWDEKGRD